MGKASTCRFPNTPSWVAYVLLDGSSAALLLSSILIFFFFLCWEHPGLSSNPRSLLQLPATPHGGNAPSTPSFLLKYHTPSRPSQTPSFGQPILLSSSPPISESQAQCGAKPSRHHFILCSRTSVQLGSFPPLYRWGN